MRLSLQPQPPMWGCWGWTGKLQKRACHHQPRLNFISSPTVLDASSIVIEVLFSLDSCRSIPRIMSPIASRAKKCVSLFEDLAEHLGQPSHQRDYGISDTETTDAFGRFKIWAGNIGALQQIESKSSLDFRLRDSPKISTQILEILVDLAESLEDGAYIFWTLQNILTMAHSILDCIGCERESKRVFFGSCRRDPRWY